jgi:exodeoxyribonuclease VII small subunit
MAKSKPGYRELKQALDQVMAELQSDDLDVDEALKLYQKGLELVGQLEHYLKTAETTLTELRTTPASGRE